MTKIIAEEKCHIINNFIITHLKSAIKKALKTYTADRNKFNAELKAVQEKNIGVSEPKCEGEEF